MSLITVICSRCKEVLRDVIKTDTFTGGYYEVHKGYWSKFAKPGEQILCDACMFKDEGYIEEFGKHSL